MAPQHGEGGAMLSDAVTLLIVVVVLVGSFCVAWYIERRWSAPPRRSRRNPTVDTEALLSLALWALWYIGLPLAVIVLACHFILGWP